ncbi:hypothetical protein [Pseudomonas sp. ICMP 460]|uniref:hypothetical protein n=1 Tax=Pseudomonas sp. ICMP 460 TaxID=1718917 RepID=UPI001179BCC7|nr:hypothetical protein [Pseudomonas sp. ICMP 460]
MRTFSACFIIGLIISAPVRAHFEQVTIPPQTERNVTGDCIGGDDSVQVRGGVVSIINSMNETYLLNFDKQSGELLGYFGAAGNPKVCVLTLKYGESDVNESYSLFVYDVGLGKFKTSRVKTVTNPDFINGGIFSDYTDGPFRRREKLCYSDKIKDYYKCENSEEFSEQLERRQMCTESSCSEPQILKQSTSNVVEATVSEDKVYFLEKNIDGGFDQKQAYLLKGDKIVLNDYYESGEGLYYQVTYIGKVITKGWVRDSSIVVGNN